MSNITLVAFWTCTSSDILNQNTKGSALFARPNRLGIPNLKMGPDRDVKHCSLIQNIRQWMKSRKPALLRVMYHQNPSEFFKLGN